MLPLALKGLLGLAFAVAFAAYIARPRFPPSARNHGLKTFIGLNMKFINLMSDIGEWMGYSPVNVTRTVSAILSAARKYKPDDSVEVYTTTMDGVEVMVYKPVGSSEVLRPGTVFYHGGGWTFLSPERYIPVCQKIAMLTQGVVVAVNYRKAPEHLYPIPLEDCLTATRYFLNNADKYGVDKNKIGVEGDSAGGNLAMAVALKLSKETVLPKLKFMVLIYPALQAFGFCLPSYVKYETGPGILTKRSMIRYWLLYGFGNFKYYDLVYDNNHLRNESLKSRFADYVNEKLLPQWLLLEESGEIVNHSKEKVAAEVPDELIKKITDPLFAPLVASDEDLKLLPRTYIFNAEFDVLRDEGFILVERMKRLGLDVTYSYLTTEEHGFLNLVPIDPLVSEEMQKMATFCIESLKD